jgi:glycosyltransferase involved in cell wall biosynthesis
MSAQYYPFVSVIIPVFNDLHRLKKCLQALESQTYRRDRYEIIVVDNGSDENIESIEVLFPRVRISYERSAGSYAARNRGICLAKGEIIAFTDSDCIPTSDWIAKGVEHLQHTKKCGLVGGKIELFYKKPQSPTSIELYDQMTFLDQEKYIGEYHFAATANAFTYKNVIEDVGPFNASLKSSGDSEWGKRVYEAGYRLVYANNARVFHPTRHSFSQLRRKIVRHTGGRYLTETEEFSMMGLLREVRKLLPPVRYVIRLNSDSRLLGLGNKHRIIFIMVLARYVRVLERLRLQLGGRPVR